MKQKLGNNLLLIKIKSRLKNTITNGFRIYLEKLIFEPNFDLSTNRYILN